MMVCTRMAALLIAGLELAQASVGGELRGTGGVEMPQVIDDSTVEAWQYDEGSLAGEFDVPEQTQACTAYQVSAGKSATCVILSDNKVKCWGDNANGQLGIGTSGNDKVTQPPASAITEFEGAESISVSSDFRDFVCTRSGGWTGSDVRCWGSNSAGQVNGKRGDPESQPSPLEVPSVVGMDVDSVVAGVEHSCACMRTGEVRCWGSAGNGRLGNGNSGGGNANLGGKASKVCAGYQHSCALMVGGQVKCWGAGIYLGQDSANDVTGATTIPNVKNLETATDIACGGTHTCAVLSSGALKCWGQNNFGQLGQDSTNPYGEQAGIYSMSALRGIGGWTNVRSVTAGREHTCATFLDSTVKCWGSGSNGKLGTGGESNVGHTSASMAGLQPINITGAALQVSAGDEHTCLISGTDGARSGDLYCWGGAGAGQLGQGNTNRLTTPPTAKVKLGTCSVPLITTTAAPASTLPPPDQMTTVYAGSIAGIGAIVVCMCLEMLCWATKMQLPVTNEDLAEEIRAQKANK